MLNQPNDFMEMQGAYLFETGGGCSAYRVELFQYGDCYALITDGECAAPANMDNECTLAFFNGNDEQIDISGIPSDAIYKTEKLDGISALLEAFECLEC